MSKLQDLIRELCPKGVEYLSLGKYIDIYTGIQFNKRDMSEVGTYPVLNGGINPSGFTERFNEQENTIAISQGGASAGYVNWMKCKFWAGAHCFIVKPNMNILNNRYLYFLLKNSEQALMQSKHGAGIPGLSRDKIKNLIIPIPPLAVQEEIVRILDHLTNLTAELQAELQARKEQYKYYRDQLLTFGEHAEGVEWKKLKECAEIGTGSSNTQDELSVGLYPFFVRSQSVRRKNEYEFDETAIITSGDGVGVGKIFHYVEGKYALHQRAYRIHVFDVKVMPKFLFHYMRCEFYNYITKNAYTSSVTSIRKPMLLNFPIPMPSLAEQQRIVSILDKFETLVNDLSQGLPAEIAAVQEQYEYYRNKLLSFQEIKEV